jgi:hypothetical protein
LDALRAEEPEDDSSRWDTHPSTAVRIATITAAPRTSHPVDSRPAAALLPWLDHVGLQLQREVVKVGSRTVLSWDDFTARSIGTGEQQRADRIFRSVGRRTGSAAPGLADVFDLVAAGRLGELAEEFFPDATRKEATAKFAGPMDMLMTLAAVQSGAAHWRHSWSGPAELVDTAGQPFDLESVATLAVSPDTVGEARARLAALGVRVEQARVVEQQATASGAEIIGALANVKVEGIHADLFILSRGLVFAPAPKSTDDGKERVHQVLATVTPERLAEMHRYIAFEDMVAVTISKRSPARAQITLHGGSTVTFEERWTGFTLADSQDTLLAVLDRVAQRAPA